MGYSPWGGKESHMTEHAHTPLTLESYHMLVPSAQSLISPSLLNSILSCKLILVNKFL